jgi:hypothetical protein
MSMAPATVLAQGFTEALTMTDAIKGSMQIAFNTRNEFDTTGKAPLGSPALGRSTSIWSTSTSSTRPSSRHHRAASGSRRRSSVTLRKVISTDLRVQLKNPANSAQTVTLSAGSAG